MALEDILRALEDKARTTVESIKSEAEKEKKRIMAEAQNEAARIRRQRLKKIEDALRSEATAMIYSATLKAKKEVNQAREEVVENVFRIAQEKISRLSEEDSYSDIFKALLDECVELIDGEIVFQVRPEDRSLLERLLAEKGIQYSISDVPLESSGGLNAMSADGRIIVYNTFEKRLERAKKRLRLEISNILFPD